MYSFISLQFVNGVSTKHSFSYWMLIFTFSNIFKNKPNFFDRWIFLRDLKHLRKLWQLEVCHFHLVEFWYIDIFWKIYYSFWDMNKIAVWKWTKKIWKTSKNITWQLFLSSFLKCQYFFLLYVLLYFYFNSHALSNATLFDLNPNGFEYQS